MSRDVRLLLDDVVESCKRISRYTAGLTYEEFRADGKTFDAVARNLEIIGEAVKKLPESVRAAHVTVEWRKVAGLRDVVIHQYFGIDEELIWDVVQNWIPALQVSVGDILATLGNPEP